MKFGLGYLQANSAALGVVCAVAGIVVGTAATFTFNHFNNSQALLKSDFEAVRTAEILVDNSLQPFANKAIATGSLSPKSVEDLTSGIKSLYSASQQLTFRYPALAPQSDKLFVSMKELQDSALRFQGPADAKPFVEAVDAYYLAQDAFNDKAIAKQGSWIP